MRDLALAGAVFILAVFALYTRTHVASLFADDSGETATLAVVLGIGHPPGYPLHTLMGRLWVLGPAPGAPCVSMNLLAALLGALSAGLAFVFLTATLGRDLRAVAAAALAALALALGPSFWHNALGAKGSIYQLNNLLSLGLLLCAYAPGQGRKAWACFWLLSGLALSHHYMSQVPLVPVYALAWSRIPRERRPWSQLWLSLPGAALILYLPWRAQQYPDLNWGGMQGLSDLPFFLLRKQYSATELSRSSLTSLKQAWAAIKMLMGEGSWLLSPLALWGLYVGRHKRWTQALAFGMAAGVLAIAVYLNLSEDRYYLIRAYLFPAYLCQALLAAQGAVALFEALATRASTLALALLAALLAQGAWRYRSQDLSRYFFALDHARELIAGLPHKTLLLAEGDALVFPLWYLQRVEHWRRDVAVVGMPVLPMNWVREELAAMHPDLQHPVMLVQGGAEAIPFLSLAYLEMNPQRPLFAAFNRFTWDSKGWSLRQEGPHFRCLPPGQNPPLDMAVIRNRLALGNLRGYFDRPLDERTLTLIVGDRAIFENAAGVVAEEAQAFALAYAQYKRAAALHPESADFPFNQGNALYSMGQKMEALEAYQGALRLDPAYANAWFNLGVVAQELGKPELTAQAFKTLYRMDPTRPGVADWLKARGEKL